VWGLSCQGQNTCPKKAILEDVAEAIQTWKEAGDKVLLMTDFNDDIHDPDTIQFFGHSDYTQSIWHPTACRPLKPTSMGEGP